MTSYGPLFTFPDLESQLLFINKDRDFHKENASELLEYIYKLNLQDCLPEVVKLWKMNGVIAISSVSVEQSFSCLCNDYGVLWWWLVFHEVLKPRPKAETTIQNAA